jgi:hypothetical protein
MAWKNGAFGFNNTEIIVALRQLERWYDIRAVYPEGLPHRFLKGKMGRDLSLLQAIRILKSLGLTCRLEGNNLIVLP